MKKIFIVATSILFCSCAAFANETVQELSEEAEKEFEVEAKPSTWMLGLEKARKDVEDKYGTTFSAIINSQYQLITRAKNNEGRRL